MTDLQPAAPPVPEADERVEAPAVPSPSPSPPPASAPPPKVSATKRVRARLARRMTPQRAGAGRRRCSSRSRACTATLHPKADLALLQRAYDVAEAKHEGQKRKSGDPYITHPLAVATILAELGMDTTTLVAALLHDTVEDTDYSLEQLRADFGEEVAHLVDGVTKLDKVELGNAAEAETIRKMVVAMARDPRVLVIKLADRLHNMRTMRFLPPEKQAKKARETLEVLAPLAHRLGMATVKWELEDLSFAILHPKKYSEIVRLVATRAPSRDTYLKQVIDEVTQQLDSARITATVEGRPKHYYSIYRKMIVKGRDFDDIHDLVGRAGARRRGARLLRGDGHGARAVAADARPVQGLHRAAAVRGVPVAAHHGDRAGRQAARGADPHPRHAPHRRVRHRGALALQGDPRQHTGRGQAVEVDEMAWMRQLLDWQREAADPGDFLESLRFDLAAKEIFVFTPEGRRDHAADGVDAGRPGLRRAHRGRAPVHRLAGERPAGRAGAQAGVRRRRRDLHLEGRDGRARAATGWRSSPRRGPRRRSSSGSPRSAARRPSRSGKDAITREARRTGMPLQRLVSADAMAALARELHFPDLSGLYAAVGEGHVSAPGTWCSGWSRCSAAWRTPRRSSPSGPPRRRSGQRKSAGDAGVVVRGDDGRRDGLYTKLARCCTPVPGDEILGFVTRGGGVSACTARTARTPATCRRGRSGWSTCAWSVSPGSVFLVAIQVEALDRHRLLSDITKVLADEKVNILSASVHDVAGPGGGVPVHASRWATPSTSGTCCGRCATSRASTTCTG